MSTLVELGFTANTSDLVTARNRMNDLSDSGGRADSTFQGLQRTLGLVTAAVAVLGTASAVRDVANYSEVWKSVNNQLRIVVDSEEQLITTRTKLLSLSKDTRSNLLATTSLYAELYRNTRSLNTEESQLLTVTGTLNNLFVAGAKDAGTQESAIRQLSQALGTGALRGDEYISVTEAAPRVIDALSLSLGKAKGEMRDFAATGGITSEVLIKALTSYASTAQDLFDKTEKAESQYYENARTNAAEYFGQMESLTTTIHNFGGFVESASENLDSLTDAAVGFASVLGGAVVLSLAKAGVTSVSTSIASGVASVQLTRQRAAQALATQTATAAEVAMFTAQRAGLVNSIASIESESIRATLRTRLAVVNGSLATSEAALAVATATATRATVAATASTISLTAATTAFGVALKFALGPWGLLIAAVGTAAAIFLTSKENSDLLSESLLDQAKSADELRVSLNAMNEAQVQSEMVKETAKVNELMVQRLLLLDEQNEIINNAGSGGGQFSNIKGYGGLATLNDEVKALDEQIALSNRSLETMQGVLIKINKEEVRPISIGSTSKLTAAEKEYNKWLESVTGYLTPLEEAELKIERVNQAIANGLPVTSNVINYLQKAREELQALNEKAENTEYIEWIESIASEETAAKLRVIQEEITETFLAMDGGDLSSSAAMKHIEELEEKARELKGVLTGSEMFASVSDSAITGLQSIQGLSEQGSKEYAKLGVAIQAVTALQAISAVVNQATGDPYTAFGRMAAMISAIGALGVSVGGLSGGFSDDSADNQASQGLNSWGDKSESISNSIDITASATDKLVSINTGMLSALETMASDISSAVLISLKSTEYDDLTTSVSVNENLFDGLDNLLGSFVIDALGVLSGGFITGLLSNTLFDSIGSFLGGSSSTTDKGISVSGGTLGELSTAADVDAYIDTKYKTWKFGSTHRRTDYADLDDASAQFTLVFASLADTVYTGATTLGLGASEVTAAINSFEIETQKISLKGLSAEDQQTEVEAVFSSIFDSLAISIVPYLDDFQEIGEGYGETLARVATQVSVAEVLANSLGVELGDKLADPEMYLTISNNLSTLAGGIEDFADQVSSFIDSFAPDSVKLEIYTDAMKEALNSVGLSIPSTTEGFYELMNGLDGTTEAGQEQISTLLGLTDTAEEYYDLLENTVGDLNDSLETLTESIMSTIDSMFSITYEDALTSLDDALLLARAGSFNSALDLDLTALSADESDFKSLADYNIAQAKTGNKLSELASLTGEEMTTADYALNESIEQTSLLKSLKEAVEYSNELLFKQNTLQTNSANSLDTINNKTGYSS